MKRNHSCRRHYQDELLYSHGSDKPPLLLWHTAFQTLESKADSFSIPYLVRFANGSTVGDAFGS